MSKTQKSNREIKKEPTMTLKQKRAAKRAKGGSKGLLGGEAERKPIVVPTAKRS